jgi:maleylacetoacetate isomerase
VRALVETINAGVQPLQNLSVLDRVSADAAARQAWMKHFIARGLQAFEALMESSVLAKQGPFAAGATLSMADCCLVPQVYAARRNEVDLSPFPNIVRAEAAAMQLACVAAAKPEAQADAKV